MANDYFQFKRFTVSQSRCAMKVGTDGTLLGAWARVGERVLDIGTGTGLLALMIAQRHPSARVCGVDIDADAVAQATANFQSSPFADRLSVCQMDVREFQNRQDAFSPGSFDAIVCNPPFFDHALPCPTQQRSQARHTSSLDHAELAAAAAWWLADGGEFSVVMPFDYRERFTAKAQAAGLALCRECAVKTTPRKPPRRYLLAFVKAGQPVAVEHTEGVLEEEPGRRSPWYQQLTKDFYL